MLLKTRIKCSSQSYCTASEHLRFKVYQCQFRGHLDSWSQVGWWLYLSLCHCHGPSDMTFIMFMSLRTNQLWKITDFPTSHCVVTELCCIFIIAIYQCILINVILIQLLECWSKGLTCAINPRFLQWCFIRCLITTLVPRMQPPTSPTFVLQKLASMTIVLSPDIKQKSTSISS